MYKLTLCITLFAACGGDSGGADFTGVYPIETEKFANGGSFDCSDALTEDMDPDAFLHIFDDDFGMNLETCSDAAGTQDCFPVFGASSLSARGDGYRGTFATASSSGGLCSLNHTTVTLEPTDSGGVRFYRVERYQSGDENNCDLAAAEAISNVTTCSYIEEIVTSAAQ